MYFFHVLVCACVCIVSRGQLSSLFSPSTMRVWRSSSGCQAWQHSPLLRATSLPAAQTRLFAGWASSHVVAKDNLELILLPLLLSVGTTNGGLCGAGDLRTCRTSTLQTEPCPQPRGRLFQMRLNIKNAFLAYKTQGTSAALCHCEFWPSSSCQNLVHILQLSTLHSLPPLCSSDRAALTEKQNKTKSSLLWLPRLHLHSRLYVLSRRGALKKLKIPGQGKH